MQLNDTCELPIRLCVVIPSVVSEIGCKNYPGKGKAGGSYRGKCFHIAQSFEKSRDLCDGSNLSSFAAVE
jgi:hypothetical protein